MAGGELLDVPEPLEFEGINEFGDVRWDEQMRWISSRITFHQVLLSLNPLESIPSESVGSPKHRDGDCMSWTKQHPPLTPMRSSSSRSR